ncbi:MAG: hypothetical protein ABL949_15515 [Fimbriimonadaceae bacterium]
MRWILCAGLLLGLLGCAKIPGTGAGAGGTRLIFKMTVGREINPNYIYMVALRPSNDPNPPELGPIPVIAPPWGNGFVAGECTHFVEWANSLPRKYELFSFRDTTLVEYRSIGNPVVFRDVATGDKVIQFELELTQLVSLPADADLLESLQFNFFTMDRIPIGLSGSKNWDALGDGRLASEINFPITIPLRTSGTYDNARFSNREPNGDVADPDLDIVDWSVEVQRR